jgi:hypothetical protein
LDIESVPGPNYPKLEDVKVPENYKKPETIAAYQQEKLEEAYQKQALDSLKGEICCIGYALDNDPAACFNGDEPTILATLNELLGDHKFHDPIFIGWNVRNFDLPWLWRKSLKYGFKEIKHFFRDRQRNSPFIVDLMEVFATEWRDFVSLNNAAKFLGLPVDDTFTGKDVYEAWKKKYFEAISGHCLQDINLTREIYRIIFE